MTETTTKTIIKEKIACCPAVGDYDIITDMLLQKCLGYKTVHCPPINKRTLELGERYAPDMVCTPFKISLGNFIEAAEKGANVFVLPGVVCRLGFFDILQEQILRELGYDCEFLILFDYVPTIASMYEQLHAINSNLTQEYFYSVFSVIYRIAFDKDYLADFMRKNMAFEVKKGEFEECYNAYLQEAGKAQSVPEAESIFAKHKARMESITINKPENPIRIAIMGEITVAVAPYANRNIENWLAQHEVEIIRPIDWSSIGLAVFQIPELIKNSGGYVKYNIGSTANEVVALSHELMQEGIDGIIHSKPATCSPELTGMAILKKMAADFDTPVLFMTFDTAASETGVHTRLEAFHDMLVMRRGMQKSIKKLKKAYMGIDIGSISTKCVVIDEDNNILADSYVWTSGNPIEAVKNVLNEISQKLDTGYTVVNSGTTGSARKLIGVALGSRVIKNEISAHAIGTLSIVPDVRTILEIGGQDSKIILVNNGIVVDYAMNTICAAGTGAFLSSQAKRLELELEDFTELALTSTNPAKIAARCTVFAESDLVHKAQIGYSKADIAAGLCRAIVLNYLNNVGKGKQIKAPIVFQGGVSKNAAVTKEFEKELDMPVHVDPKGHLMGALGVAVLCKDVKEETPFDFCLADIHFETKGVECTHCPNNCEIICVYKNAVLLDAWGNKCEKGAQKHAS